MHHMLAIHQSISFINDHFSDPGSAIGLVCVRTTTFEQNDL